MCARVGKGTLAFLADPGLSGVRDLSLHCGPPPHPPQQEEGEPESTDGGRVTPCRKLASPGSVPGPGPLHCADVRAHVSVCLDGWLAARSVWGPLSGGGGEL